MRNLLKIKKLDSKAKIPQKAHNTDAGYDIFALECGTITAKTAKMFRTGIAMEIPRGYYGQIHARSSWFKDNYDSDGVIDSGYRGEIKVIIQNQTYCDASIRAGDKIAQIIILPCPEFETVVVDELSETDRGDGGFGSTGR